MKATHRLIDSVWTLEFKILNETEVEILNYSRTDKEGYLKEKELPQVCVIEDDDRIVKRILIREKYKAFDNFVTEETCDKSYKVANPKHVFDYEK